VIPASACADRHCARLDADCDALAVELRFGRVLVEAVSRDALGASVGATTRTMAASMPFKLTGCGGAPRLEVLAQPNQSRQRQHRSVRARTTGSSSCQFDTTILTSVLRPTLPSASYAMAYTT
jgi:hypothetical protein